MWFEVRVGSIDVQTLKYMVQRVGRRPQKTWQKPINEDLKIWNINPNNIQDRTVWRNERSAMKSPTCRKS